MNLAGFAGLEGLGDGMSLGLNLMQRIEQMRAAQAQQRARGATGRMLMADSAPPLPQIAPQMAPQMPAGPMPQPPMPGQASMPGGPQPMMDPTEMGAMALDGAPPLPQMGGEPMLPPEPVQQMGAGGDPLAGAAAETGNVVMDAQGTIKNIAQQIKAANPDISPEDLFEATNLHIEQMKGVRNDVKDYMVQQVELAKVQARIQAAEMRLQGQLGAAETNADARVEAARIGGDSRRDVAQTQAGARVDSANIGAGSRENVAGTQANARIRAAEIGGDSRVDSSANAANARMYDSDQRYRGSVDGGRARAGTGGPVTGATRPVNKPAIRSSGGGRGNGGNQWSTLKQLQDAVAAGRVPRETAIRIAREKGWGR